MKVLLGPTNFADQAMTLTRALRERGIDARHVLYSPWRPARFAYEHDEVVELCREDWLQTELSVVNRALEDGVQIFHLWHRTLVEDPFTAGYGFFSGLDLPYLRTGGARIAYSFTGYDVRRRSRELEINPYSPYHAGLDLGYDEETQAAYLDYLRQWTDTLVALDPELQGHAPDAEILPRVIELDAFDFVGVERSSRPLVVHAPSAPSLKGTDSVVAAAERLQREGLQFTFKLIEGMGHREATEWYRRADVIVDQLLVGWYGVLAVEAMALGKPVIAYVLPSLYESFRPDLPIVNAAPHDFADRLRDLVVDADRRLELAERGRRFVEEVHDARKVAEQAEALYRRLLAEPPKQGGAPHYLERVAPASAQALARAHSFSLLEKDLPKLRQKANAYDALTSEPNPPGQKPRRFALLRGRVGNGR